MFLDGELAAVRRAKADVAERAALRRQVLTLEAASLRARLGRLSLCFGFAGRFLDFLKRRRH